MPYKAKCNYCREIGETDTDSINKAIFSIKHNPNCPFLLRKEKTLRPDVIDTTIARDF